MKRELKAEAQRIIRSENKDRKAHPDEKGTESQLLLGLAQEVHHRKAHPDEKGTESICYLSRTGCRRRIARPIPMKRELKGFLVRHG